jgi:hypothetical protein
MALLMGMCPECNNILALKKRSLFCQCDNCGSTVAVRDAGNYLGDMCTEPTYADKVMELCLDLEEKGETEKALGVIAVLAQNHPYDEDIAFTYARMSGYEIGAVRLLLERFSNKKGEAGYAQEILDNIMDMPYIMLVPMMVTFAQNRLNAKLRPKYIEVLESLRAEYTEGMKNENSGINSIYAFYVAGGVLNVLMIVLLYFLGAHLAVNLILVLVLFAVEFSLLYLHNRIYGNRLGIEKIEKYLMLVFMCSVPFAIGGAVICWLVR